MYVPPGTNSAIIITSRDAECCRFNTVGSEIIGGLDLEHATKLLIKSTNLSADLYQSHELLAREVVKELGSHTLAIIQAGTYIGRGHCNIAGYLGMYQKQRSRLMKFKPKQWRPRYGDVYATFEASASILELSDSETAKDALELLRVLSMLHFSWLPFEFFQTAWYRARRLPSDDPLAKKLILTRQHATYLPSFICLDDHQWDSYRFIEAISLLASFSLVITDIPDGIAMHPLTHAWAQDRQSDQQQRESWISAGFSMAVSYKAYFWQQQQMQLHPHVISYLGNRVKEALLITIPDVVLTIMLNCGWILCKFEEGDRLHQLLEDIFRILRLDRTTLSRDYLNVYRLEAQHLIIYRKPQQGVQLLKQLSAIEDCQAETTDVERLYTQHELALAYQANGQFTEAVDLLKQAVQIESALVEDEFEQLDTQFTLAEAFVSNGHAKEAVPLLERVVRMEENMYVNHHPSLLNAQHGLARAYLANGQSTEALKLLEHVAQVEKRTLGEGHPQALSSQHTLARAYLANEETENAVRLLKQVVQMRQDTLEERHQYRLASEHELSRAYLENRQVQEAKALLEKVVQIKADALSQTHPSLLSSEHLLGRVYLKDGKMTEAIYLQEKVVRIREDTLPESNQTRLVAQHELARAYVTAGKDLRKATGMLERIVQIEERTLTESHPKRLASRRVLARAYVAQNQDVGKAVELLEEIVQIEQRTLREDHPRRLFSQQELAKAYLANEQRSAGEELLKDLEQFEGSRRN